MKLNSKLWMLAVALATVGCQDDLGNDPNGGTQGNGLEGEKAKIAVAVNTGITTRADNPTPGEEGDGDEAGTIEESRVNDVTIFLYDNDEAGSSSPSTDFEFKSSSNIIAAGFATTDGQMDAGTPEHSFYKEVEVTITDPKVSWIGKKVGVIAVTNLGKADSDKLIAYVNQKGEKDEAKGSRLADYLQDDYRTDAGFVMSTHTIGGNGLEESTVTLKATQGSEPAPEVNVYVERLAAKIRINEHEGNNFVYTVTHNLKLNGSTTTTEVKDAVILNDVAIVNQLTSGSYMIKRVTPALASGETDLDMTATSASSDNYLYRELGNATQAATNFVIDPWTRYKIPMSGTNILYPTNANGVSISYGNRFYSPEPINNYAQLWNTFASHSTLHSGSDFSAADNQRKDLCYTMENTTSVAASQNGYSTGAVFKATYYPGAWGVAVDDASMADPTVAGAKGYNLVSRSYTTTSGEGENATTTYTPADFYLYQGNVFQDRAAIFAYILSNTVPSQLAAGESLSDYYRYCDFAGETMDENFSIADFKASHAATANDPFGYIAYLNRLSDDTKASDVLTFSKFLASPTSDSNPHSVILNPESVTYYQNGDSYYPFWIRHANNGNPNEMGVMEFGIVRNNIYDMTVAGINGYGFVTPVPSTPDENPELRINVVLYVKDWTLRKNDNIYL